MQVNNVGKQTMNVDYCKSFVTDAQDGRIIRLFLYSAGRIPNTENSRISGQIEKITTSFNKISKNLFLKH
jgi:hypothetical protein